MTTPQPSTETITISALGPTQARMIERYLAHNAYMRAYMRERRAGLPGRRERKKAKPNGKGNGAKK